MSWTHYFDEDAAKEYGVPCAVVIELMRSWIRKNKANGQNLHDERTWTYNSTKAWAELLPFFSRDQVVRILRKLLTAGVLVQSRYNRAGFDRTLWYAFNDESRWLPIVRNRQMEHAGPHSGLDGSAQPIPSSLPSSPPSSESLSGKPDDMPSEFYFQVIDYLNDTTGSKYRDTTPSTRRMINQRWKEGFRADDFQAVIDGRWDEWKGKKDMVQYMRPETLFCAKHFESYLQAAKSRRPA